MSTDTEKSSLLNVRDAVDSLLTIRDFIRFAFSQFNQTELYFGHGTDNSWDEATALVLQSLELPLDFPHEWFDSRLTTAEKQMLADKIQTRIDKRLPLAYLTNKAWFAGIEFYVDERVLVPRSPIAELIDNQFAPRLDIESTHSILDMCTGSGCIALACAMHFPHTQVVGADISADALAVAQINQQKYAVDNISFVESDGFAQLQGQKFDLIVSNPPYVDAEDFAEMPDEYHAEPEIGLASGDDGLDFTRRMLAQAADHLTENGVLIVEVGNSAVALEQAFPQLAFTRVEFERGGDGVFVLDKSQLLSLQA